MNRKRNATLQFSSRGKCLRVAAFAVGVVALLINLTLGGLAAHHHHGDKQQLARLLADLAILCAPDVGTQQAVAQAVDSEPREQVPLALPHCQSCLPFFAVALLPSPPQATAPVFHAIAHRPFSSLQTRVVTDVRFNGLGARAPPQPA